HGYDGLAAPHTGRAAAGFGRDPGGRARRYRGERGDGDDRGRHRRRRPRRVHLPRRGGGGRHAHPGRGAAGGPHGARGGRAVRPRGAAVRVAREMRRRWPLGVVALLLAGCAHRDRIVVGSKNFTESDLLGEIVAQQIERRTGLAVARRFHLGGTFVCHQAITAGQIDLYVEYTGTAYTAVLKHAPVADRDSVSRVVASDYAQR